MVLKRVKCLIREMNIVRVKSHCVSQLGFHWWYVEVLLLRAKTITSLKANTHIPYTFLQLSYIQLSSLCLHLVLKFPPLNPSSVPFQDQLTILFLLTKPLLKQDPILMSVPSYASPTLAAPVSFHFLLLCLQSVSVSLWCFFSCSVPHLAPHVGAQARPGSPTPRSECISHPPVGLPFAPDSARTPRTGAFTCTHHLLPYSTYWSLHLHPPSAWHWSWSHSLETFLASHCPTFLCLSLSHFQSLLSLCMLFFFFSPDYVLLYFVPVLFLDLLILERSIPKEVPYLSEANTDVFIGAMI